MNDPGNIDHGARDRVSGGFTLLEIMVAISILLMIVMMMAAMFDNSVKAWDSGRRKTEMSMEGRAVVNFMAHELSQAVADSTLKQCNIGNGSWVQFYTMGPATMSNRSARLIRYELLSGGPSGGVVKRTVQWLGVQGYPDMAGGTNDEHIMAIHVKDLSFATPGGSTYTSSLPVWVQIDLELEIPSEHSGVEVWCKGPDNQWNTDDDICSWKHE